MMNQYEYLQELKIGLSGRLSESEIQDIIEEYQGFFTDGLAEGRTEDAISKSLGSPAQLVGTLTEDEKNQTPKSPAQTSIDGALSNTLGFMNRKVSPPLATLWQRIGASLIDRIFLLFVMLALIIVFGQIYKSSNNGLIAAKTSETQTIVLQHIDDYSAVTAGPTIQTAPNTSATLSGLTIIILIILASFVFPLGILGIFFLLFISFTYTDGSASSSIQSGPLLIPLVFLAALLVALYKPVIESIWNGRTIGKRLFGIRVSSADGSRAGVGRILVRELIGDGLLGSLTGGITTIISIFTVAIGIPHKSVPDYIASTIVIIDNPKRQSN